MVAEFERRRGVRIRQVYFDADDLRDDYMIKTEEEGYDLVVVAGYKLDQYRRYGLLARVDEAAVPNLHHIDPRWRDAFPGTREYGAPYFWGTLGIAYREDLLTQVPTRWMDLFRPPPEAHGRIAMIEDATDVIGMALKALGYSVNETRPEALKAVEALLQSFKPHVRSWRHIDLGPDSPMVRGEVAMAMV